MNVSITECMGFKMNVKEVHILVERFLYIFQLFTSVCNNRRVEFWHAWEVSPDIINLSQINDI